MTRFFTYELLIELRIRYGCIDPWIGIGAGIMMTATVRVCLSGPAVLAKRTIGPVGMHKTIHIDERDPKGACVGGGRTVPLGVLSLTGSLMAVGMTIATGCMVRT